MFDIIIAIINLFAGSYIIWYIYSYAPRPLDNVNITIIICASFIIMIAIVSFIIGNTGSKIKTALRLRLDDWQLKKLHRETMKQYKEDERKGIIHTGVQLIDDEDEEQLRRRLEEANRQTPTKEQK